MTKLIGINRRLFFCSSSSSPPASCEKDHFKGKTTLIMYAYVLAPIFVNETWQRKWCKTNEEMIFTLCFYALGLGLKHLWPREIVQFLKRWLRKSVNGIRVYTNYMEKNQVLGFSEVLRDAKHLIFCCQQNLPWIPSLFDTNEHTCCQNFSPEDSIFCICSISKAFTQQEITVKIYSSMILLLPT